MFVESRKGFANNVKIECLACEAKEVAKNSLLTSYEIEGTEHKVEQINLRFIYAMRIIGKGYASAKRFCGAMNLPPPSSMFFRNQRIVSEVVSKMAKKSMKAAVEDSCSTNEDSRELAISLDGTWQKRGHSSLNGIVSAASIDNGKIIDLQVVSKYCRCTQKAKNIHTEACLANYSGTSGGMEVFGATEIFKRSEAEYNVRYNKYLGDGDSKGFLKVVESQPYGDVCNIEKLECLGHVKKRMGTRLRKLKSVMGKIKLADGHPIGGRYRLTLDAINNIQTYYGLVIIRNNSNLESMKKSVWAVYFHLASNDKEPCHALCTEEWCKYRKAQKEDCWCLNLTGILVPRYKLEGEDALLECQYQLQEKSLYAVKWYKTDEEFFKYVQRANPPTTSYPVEGINVDHARSDRRRVLLRNVSPLSSGVYRCEVSAEAPSFSSATAAARMTVQHLPETGPHITGERKQYLIGDEVNLNCTSGKSYPASVLHWYINDLEVKTEEQGLQPYPELRAEGGLVSSHLGLGLHLMKYHFRRGRAELRCVASYPLPDPRQAPEGEALTAGGQGVTRILHQQQPPRQPNRWEAVLLVTLNGTRDVTPSGTTILVIIFSLLYLKL